MSINPDALDRHITGNYGADQYDDAECPRHGGPWGDDLTCPKCTDLDGNPLPFEEPEDDRDFDSMPGGWDEEEYGDDEPDPDRFWDNR